MHQGPPSYGFNSGYGNNHYGGYSQPNTGFGHHQPMPNYGGGFMPMQSGYGGVMPMNQQRSSSGMGMGILGGALTGLATYQLARAIGGGYGGGHHSESTQHIYHHHEYPEQAKNNNNPAQPNAAVSVPNQLNNNNNQPPYAQTVPLASYEITTTKCTENCGNDDANKAVTPIPEIDYEFPYSTIHPSLFSYASPEQNQNIEYWANSLNKNMSTSSPDTDLSF